VSSYPGDHPEPPADLAHRSPLVLTLTAGTRLSRIHKIGQDPLFFGRTRRNRFDSPDGTYGVLYTGFDEFCAFIETFGQNTGISIVTITALKERHLSYLTFKNPLTLIDLASSGGLARIGADGRLLTGSHEIAQRWSAALRAHPVHPHGIVYPARHDVDRRACALFDLPVSTFEVVDSGSLVEPHHSVLLGSILDTYGFGLVD
jgi:hypothetical protein